MECCPYEYHHAKGGNEWLKADGSRLVGSQLVGLQPEMDCRWRSIAAEDG